MNTGASSFENVTQGARPLIVHVINRLDIGGLESLLISFIDSQPAADYRHAIVCITDFTDFSRRLRRDNIELVALNKKNGLGLRSHWQFWRFIRRRKPRVVHTYNIGALEYLFLAFLAGVGIRIHAEHGREAHDPEGMNKTYNSLRRWLRPMVHAYVAVSQDLYDWLVGHVRIPKSKCVLIYNGVDTEAFNRNFSAKPQSVPGQLQCDLTVVTVGRLDPVKDQLTLIRAFASVLSGWGDDSGKPVLMIAGDGPYQERLESEIHELGLAKCCNLLGPRDDIVSILRSSDVFVLSSIAEGVPVTVLEAMACGLPVVASKVGGIPEVVMQGKTGVLVDPGDTEGFARAIAVYLKDPKLARKHGESGRERVCAEFSLDSMASRYVELYENPLCRDFRASLKRTGKGVE